MRLADLVVWAAVCGQCALSDYAWVLRSQAPNSVTVNWLSASPLLQCAAVPRNGSASGFNALQVSSTRYTGKTISYNATGFSSAPMWTVGVTGLVPGERHACQIFDGSTFAFRGPGSGLDPAKAHRHTLFLVGDVGRSSHSAAVIGAMRRHLETLGAAPPSLLVPDVAPSTSASVVLLGDLSYADGKPSEWESWQALIAPLLSAVPTTVIPGNHDVVRNDDIIAYSARFCVGSGQQDDAGVPRADSACQALALVQGGITDSPPEPQQRPGFWGAIVVPPFHVVYLCVYLVCRGALKGSSRDSLPLGVLQSAWLVQELACRIDRKLTPFLIVALHPPLYHASASHIGEQLTADVRSWLEPVLVRWRVDAVVGGHEHTFEVTKPIAFGVPQPICGGGIPHVTVGTGGAYDGGLFDSWIQPSPTWVDREGAAWYGYATIEATYPASNDPAEPARLTYWQVQRTRLNSSVAEAFEAYSCSIASHALSCADGTSENRTVTTMNVTGSAGPTSDSDPLLVFTKLLLFYGRDALRSSAAIIIAATVLIALRWIRLLGQHRRLGSRQVTVAAGRPGIADASLNSGGAPSPRPPPSPTGIDSDPLMARPGGPAAGTMAQESDSEVRVRLAESLAASAAEPEARVDTPTLPVTQ